MNSIDLSSFSFRRTESFKTIWENYDSLYFVQLDIFLIDFCKNNLPVTFNSLSTKTDPDGIWKLNYLQEF